jgi:hypothetical protein
MSAAGPIVARVVSASPSPESVGYALVTIAFENRGAAPARVTGYELTWTAGRGGRYQGAGPREPLAAGAARTRTVKIADGDYEALVADPGSARVGVT